MTETTNPHKELAQSRKAAALATKAQALGLTYAQLHALDDPGWVALAGLANVIPPSSEVIRLVLELVEES